ncbi:MAG TPA: hypothetical protein VF277_10780 [Steroidobacteraceae bacterium]
MAQDEFDDNWESTALRLVADRVQSLSASAGHGEADADIDADDGYGWEDTVIRRLRAWLYRDDPDR